MSTLFSSIDKRGKAAQWDLVFEKYAALILWAIFGLNLVLRGLIIPRLGAASFPNSDEHIFIELAKSFFYNHNFFSNGFSYIKQYNEILFPLVLSPAYWFFSPENILTVLRSYGLFLMSLVVFPAYWLGWKVLGDKKQGMLVAFISVLIPEMSLAYTVAQEVIYYPLYLFSLVLVYKKINGEKVSSVLLGLVFLLLWLCKAVGITVFLAYGVYLVFDFVFYMKLKNIKGMIFQLVVIAILVIGLKEALTLGVRYLNSGSFAAVNDFYNSAMTKFFATSLSRLLSDIPNGIFYYLFYCSIAFMVFPVILVIDHFKQYSLIDQKFLIFLGFCFLATMGTVILLVYVSEGGAVREVQRVHFRYFFPLLIPLIVLLFKIDFSRIRLEISSFLFPAFLLLYYLMIAPHFQTGSIIDAKSLLLIEKIDKGIVNGMNFLVLLSAILFAYLFYLIKTKRYGYFIRRVTISALLFIVFVNQTYAVYKTYNYYTVGTTGIERRNEYIIMAREVAATPGTPIILYPENTGWFDVLFSTQTNRDFTRMGLQEDSLEYSYDLKYPPNFVITPKNFLQNSLMRGATKLPLNMRLFDMYRLNEVTDGKIYLDYSIANVHLDGWLKENAKLLISDMGRGDEVAVTLRMSTNFDSSPIDAVLQDTTGRITTTGIDPNGTTLRFLVHKNSNEKNFVVTLGANGFFIPNELPIKNGDKRKLTYKVDEVSIEWQ